MFLLNGIYNASAEDNVSVKSPAALLLSMAHLATAISLFKLVNFESLLNKRREIIVLFQQHDIAFTL